MQNLNSADQYKVPIACFWLVFLAAASLRVTLTSLSPVMSNIAESLALSKAVVSFLVTIPIICMGVFALTAAPLSNRFGMERMITISLFLIGVSTITRSYFQSTYLLFASSLLMGIGIAIAGPLLSGYVKRYFKKRSNVGMIFYTFGISISGVLGAMSSSILNQYLGWDWSVTLEFWAAPILIISGVWAVFYLFKNANNIVEDAPKAKMPWKEGRAWMLVACFGLQSGIFYTNVAWLLPFLLEKGIGSFHANLLLNLFIFNGVFGGFIIPVTVIKIGLRATSIGAISLVILSILILLFTEHNLFLLYFSIASIGVLVSSGLFAITMLLPFNEVDNGNAIASWTAMMLFGGYCFAAFIPTLLGLLYDLTGSYSAVFYGCLLNAFVLLLFFIAFFRKKREKRSTI